MLHKSVNSDILEMKKDNRPQGGLPDYMKQKTCPIARSKSWGGFSMLRLLFYVAQKCEECYTRNEKGQPLTRWVAELIR